MADFVVVHIGGNDDYATSRALQTYVSSVTYSCDDYKCHDFIVPTVHVGKDMLHREQENHNIM